MKSKVSICIFVVGISAVLAAGFLVFKGFEKKEKTESETASETEIFLPESESAIISNVEKKPDPEPVAEFYLLEEDGRVSVFFADKKRLFMETGIGTWSLPEQLRMRLKDGIPFVNEDELYEFLESYSS